jgi:ribonuclease R
MTKRPSSRASRQDPSPSRLAQDVLAAIRRSGHAGITSQQLALQLGFKDKGQRYLLFDALTRCWTRAGLRAERRGATPRRGARTVWRGRIDIIASGAGYVRVEGGEEDIFVHNKNLGVALHGDRVLVKVMSSRGLRAEGKVLSILERRRTEFVGTIHKQQGRLMLVADDQRVQRPFFIPPHESLNAQEGDKAIIALGEWKDTATCRAAK